MFLSKTFRYSYLAPRGPSSDPREADNQSLVDQNDAEKQDARLPKPRSFLCLFQILPWVMAITSTGLLAYNLVRGPDEFTCTRMLNPYSPAIEDGIVEYYDTDFENEFAHKTKYRGPPSPEIEDAWNRIWNLGGIEIPLDGPAQLGIASSNLSHVHSDENRGYYGLLEVFHQLHCLNLIRQYTWRDYYDGHMRAWLEDPNHREIIDLNITDFRVVGDRMHVDHCIETLRLQLMCNADLTPMLVVKDDTIATGTKADFNVHHKCRNWDKVIEWQRIHTVDMNATGLRPL